MRRLVRAAQPRSVAVVAVVLTLLIASVPAGSATHDSPARLAALEASGWTNAANALTDGDGTYAATSTDGATLHFPNFADQGARGPPSQVLLRLDQQQVAHADDVLTIAASTSGCSSVTASPSEPKPTPQRTTLDVTLTCPQPWTWAMINSLSASVTARARGGVLEVFPVDGEWRIYFAWLSVGFQDAAPSADAGPDQSATEAHVVLLDGRASSDPEGFPLTFSWLQTAGTSVSLANANTATPSFAAPTLSSNVPSVLSFRLSVTDPSGHTAADSVTVTVNNVNQAPTADAGTDQSVESGRLVTLAGTASRDPDGDPLTYAWSQRSGKSVTLSSTSNASPTFEAPSGSATLVFGLIVTDPYGLSSPSDEVRITVTPAPNGGPSPSSSQAPPTSAPPTSASVPPTSASAPRTSPPASASPSVSGPSIQPEPEPAPALTCVRPLPRDYAEGSWLTFAPGCGVDAIAFERTQPTRLTIASIVLADVPAHVPAPTLDVPAVVLVDVLLTGEGGHHENDTPGKLRLRLPHAWRTSDCPEPSCNPRIVHWSNGTWADVPITATAIEGDAFLVEASVAHWSVFALGGTRVEPSSGGAVSPLWYMLLALVPLGAILAEGYRRRVRRHGPLGPGPPTEVLPTRTEAPTTTPTDSKVSRLLREMRANQEMVQFVNNAAHDLANPLTPILLQLELLTRAAQEEQDTQRGKSLAIVNRNVEQLRVLVADLKDASRLQAGKLTLHREPVDLADVVRGAYESFEAQAEAQGLALSLDASPGLVASADRVRLNQVLTNFLNNALKFTPKGGRVSLVAVREGEDALVFVQDSGLGLSPADQAALFRPFSQVHGAAQKKKGTGLGLFISKGILDGHGGKIGCTSEGPGQGSCFWFSLPLVANTEPKGPDPPADG